MKAAVFHGPHDVRIEDVPEPEAGADDIVIRTSYCGICGSDLHTYFKGSFIAPGQIMGHEFSGRVVQVGSNVKGIDVGARVCVHPLRGCGECRYCLSGNSHQCERLFNLSLAYGLPGGLAEYVRIPQARPGYNVYLLPPEVSDEEGAMIEPLSVSLHAVRLAAPEINDTVAIFGAGTVGLCALAIFKSLGAIRVIVSDISPLRLEMAEQLGADLILNPLNEDVVQHVLRLTQERAGVRGADITVDAAGVPSAFTAALQAARIGGKMIGLALHEEPVLFDPSIIVQKGLQVIGSRCYEREFQASIDLLASRRIDLTPLVTHRFALEDLPRAFETSRDSKSAAKVMITIM